MVQALVAAVRTIREELAAEKAGRLQGEKEMGERLAAAEAARAQAEARLAELEASPRTQARERQPATKSTTAASQSGSSPVALCGDAGRGDPLHEQVEEIHTFL